MPHRGTGRLTTMLGCLGIWVAVSAPAGAQTEVYCRITDVKVDRLSNATRVTLNADGLIDGSFEPGDYYDAEANDYTPRRLKAFPFRLTNCRTRLGSFVDVSAYPVSHLSFAIPRESREGVGLDVQLVLYKRGYLDYIRLGQQGFGSWVPEPPGVTIHPSRDGHSLIVLVTSDRYREGEGPREEVAPAASSLAVSADAEGRLTVQALNSTLGEVLQAVAERTGLAIAVRGGALSRASMSVAGVEAERLLRAIARAYGLSVRSVGGIHYVTEGLPTEVDSYWAAPTASFRLQHLPAEEAAELLPDFLLRYVRADAGDNTLLATGPPQLLDKLDADLREIDQPTPLVCLSAVVVEEVADGALDAASELTVPSGQHTLSTSGGTGAVSYRISGETLDDLRARLRALEERGAIRTRVCPSVTVRSGARGEMFVGRRQFFAFARPTYRGWGPGQEIALESADIGSRIVAEPWSGDGRSITVELQVQANTILTVDDQGLPLIATRSARGTVRLNSGETIVLGGMVLDTIDDRHRRAGPDGLPLVGDLGRGRRRVTGATEALVLLSARASYDAGDLAPSEDQLTQGGVG